MPKVAKIGYAEQRKEARRAVVMFAHLQRGASRITVVLKDLTHLGARIEGVAGLEKDEAVSLVLPGCKPKLAFVAWANDHCAGLEFAEPLRTVMFDALVHKYAVTHQPVPEACKEAGTLPDQDAIAA